MVGRQVDGPDRPEQVGDDDVLLGLGASAQLRPGVAPLEQHGGGVGVAGRSTCRPGRRQVLKGVHLDRPLAAERGQALGLVQRFCVLPRHLEHDLASVAVGPWRDPRAVPARLERLAEVQSPAGGQLFDPVR